MSDWQARLKAEHTDLLEKIEKLESFLNSQQSSTLAYFSQIRLHRQFHVMIEYRNILEERILHLGDV